MNDFVITHVDSDVADAVAADSRSEKDQIAGAKVTAADILAKLSDFARWTREFDINGAKVNSAHHTWTIDTRAVVPAITIGRAEPLASVVDYAIAPARSIDLWRVVAAGDVAGINLNDIAALTAVATDSMTRRMARRDSQCEDCEDYDEHTIFHVANVQKIIEEFAK